MTKAELITAMGSETGLSKADCDKALTSFTQAISDSLQSGKEVRLVGFGTFAVKERAARTGRNPRTGDTLQIAACKVPSFKAGKEFKQALN